MNRERAAQSFLEYVKDYDPEDPMIRHKITHTFRVAALAEKIAVSLGADQEAVDFAWFLGLLHDIGRFEQVRQYGTFIDAQSVDHAEFGADILFGQKLIQTFPTDGLPEEWLRIAETAIRQHNKLRLPDSLSDEALMFCQILRDADKVDIFRVVAEVPFEERIGKSRGWLTDDREISPAVMECILAHRCVPREVRRSVLDGFASHCCMAFELVYEESRRLAKEQGYLLQMLRDAEEESSPFRSEKSAGQLQILRREIEFAWQMSL